MEVANRPKIESFIDPITLDDLSDPWVHIGCSKDFNYSSVVLIIEKHKKCPWCTAVVTMQDFIPNRTLKSGLEEMQQQALTQMRVPSPSPSAPPLKVNENQENLYDETSSKNSDHTDPNSLYPDLSSFNVVPSEARSLTYERQPLSVSSPPPACTSQQFTPKKSETRSLPTDLFYSRQQGKRPSTVPVDIVEIEKNSFFGWLDSKISSRDFFGPNVSSLVDSSGNDLFYHLIPQCGQGVIRGINELAKTLSSLEKRPEWQRHDGSIIYEKLPVLLQLSLSKDAFDTNGFIDLKKIHIFSIDTIQGNSVAQRKDYWANHCKSCSKKAQYLRSLTTCTALMLRIRGGRNFDLRKYKDSFKTIPYVDCDEYWHTKLHTILPIIFKGYFYQFPKAIEIAKDSAKKLEESKKLDLVDFMNSKSTSL